MNDVDVHEIRPYSLDELLKDKSQYWPTTEGFAQMFEQDYNNVNEIARDLAIEVYNRDYVGGLRKMFDTVTSEYGYSNLLEFISSVIMIRYAKEHDVGYLFWKAATSKFKFYLNKFATPINGQPQGFYVYLVMLYKNIVEKDV